jgi:hypothetical protein
MPSHFQVDQYGLTVTEVYQDILGPAFHAYDFSAHYTPFELFVE